MRESEKYNKAIYFVQETIINTIHFMFVLGTFFYISLGVKRR